MMHQRILRHHPVAWPHSPESPPLPPAVSGDLEIKVRQFVSDHAHKKPDDWPAIEAAADELETLLGGPGDKTFNRLFHRILDEGQWSTAEAAAKSRGELEHPWVTVVGGVDGVRKLATLFQPWWPEAVQSALGVPEEFLEEHELDPMDAKTPKFGHPPSGRNSFIMPYDTIVATLTNALFISLYRTNAPAAYLDLKAAIYERYARLANIVGALILKHAKSKRMNVIFLSPATNKSPYNYVEHFFPGSYTSFYRKLTVYLDLDNISAAERTVRERLACEQEDGRLAVDPELEIWEADMRILANRGGPHGALKLSKMQASLLLFHPPCPNPLLLLS